MNSLGSQARKMTQSTSGFISTWGEEESYIYVSIRNFNWKGEDLFKVRYRLCKFYHRTVWAKRLRFDTMVMFIKKRLLCLNLSSTATTN